MISVCCLQIAWPSVCDRAAPYAMLTIESVAAALITDRSAAFWATNLITIRTNKEKHLNESK